MLNINWKKKAAIMRLFAVMPYGEKLYKYGQKKVGRLRARPMARLPVQAEMIKWLFNAGRKVEGKSFFEVGTGHIPLVPIGFYLCGAARVITVDLHRRIDWDLVRDSLLWIAEHREDVWQLYDNLVSKSIFNARFDLLTRFAFDPQYFFKEANIDYMAPMNAADTGFPEDSIDYHFSVTTLEHISPQAIYDIFKEGRRVLKKEGIAIHFVDISDHFQHQDSSITRINFLQYSENEWQRIAGNQFAYCNRLRSNDYLSLFEKLNFNVIRCEKNIDNELIELLQNNYLTLHSDFSSYCYEDICATSIRILLKKEIQ